MNKVEFAITHSVHPAMIASQGCFRVNETGRKAHEEEDRCYKLLPANKLVPIHGDHVKIFMNSTQSSRSGKFPYDQAAPHGVSAACEQSTAIASQAHPVVIKSNKRGTRETTMLQSANKSDHVWKKTREKGGLHPSIIK